MVIRMPGGSPVATAALIAPSPVAHWRDTPSVLESAPEAPGVACALSWISLPRPVVIDTSWVKPLAAVVVVPVPSIARPQRNQALAESEVAPGWVAVPALPSAPVGATCC